MLINNIVPVNALHKLTLEIFVTDKCNYDCRYCNLHTPKVKFNSIDFEKLEAFFASDHKLDLVYIYGGEPTIHPEFFKLLEIIPKNLPISLQTNLSASVKKIEKILNSRDNIEICVSYHHDFVKFSPFLKKLKLINDYKKMGAVSIMWQDRYDKEIYAVYKKVKMVFGDTVQLEPILSYSTDNLLMWLLQYDFNQFRKKYPHEETRSFGDLIIVDGERMSMLDAYINHVDLGVFGITCLKHKNRLLYNAHTNEWNHCASELAFRNPSYDYKTKTCIRDWGCAAELIYEKHRNSNINS